MISTHCSALLGLVRLRSQQDGLAEVQKICRVIGMVDREITCTSADLELQFANG